MPSFQHPSTMFWQSVEVSDAQPATAHGARHGIILICCTCSIALASCPAPPHSPAPIMTADTAQGLLPLRGTAHRRHMFLHPTKLLSVPSNVSTLRTRRSCQDRIPQKSCCRPILEGTGLAHHILAHFAKLQRVVEVLCI